MIYQSLLIIFNRSNKIKLKINKQNSHAFKNKIEKKNPQKLQMN